ncbi:1,4-dihydroxy-2-naphthoate polyprenyltransferase, partial [hydrothermal vent metagenome]
MRPDPVDNTGRGFAQWCRITRAPFLTATLVPVLFGAAMAHRSGFYISLPWLVLTLFSAAFLHIGTNTLNDYFDHRSGADAANEGYITPFTGGSRTIQSGLISARGMLTVSVVSFILGGVIAVPLLFRA